MDETEDLYPEINSVNEINLKYALQSYIGNYYRTINDESNTDEDVAKMRKLLSDFLGSKSYNSTSVLYRGSNLIELGEELKERIISHPFLAPIILWRRVYTKKGFMSTSLDKEHALHHINTEWDTCGLFVEVTNPASSKAELIDLYSGMPPEKEVLFQWNTRLKILRAKWIHEGADKILHITVKVME